MKKIETINKSREELAVALSDLKAKLVQYGFDHADKKLKDYNQFKKTKKDIARVLTALSVLK